MKFKTILFFICLMFMAISSPAQQQGTSGQTMAAIPVSLELPKDLQTELGQEKAVVIKPKDKSNWNVEWLVILANIAKYIFYGIILCAVAFILYAILKEIIRIHNNKPPEEKPDEAPTIPLYQPDAKTARIVLGDAEELAKQGRFTEAVHTLLFRSIQDITDKRPRHVGPSLTSREISELPILSQKARAGFSMITSLVEASFFGGNALGADDYAASKTAYKNFAYEKIAR